MKAEQLDALLFPGSGGAAIAARPGYPTVIVPFGLVPNAPTPAFPDGVRRAKPAPYGVSFTGLACSEPRLHRSSRTRSSRRRSGGFRLLQRLERRAVRFAPMRLARWC